jgi:hypothetical protein
LLSGVAKIAPIQNGTDAYFGAQQFVNTVPANTAHPILPRAEAGLPGPQIHGGEQLSSVGHWSLQPDQALIVKVPNIDASYTGLQLVNDWAQTIPHATVSGSLNDTQTFRDPDGFTYYVISSKDPGVANWADDSGLTNGSFQLRWQGLAQPATDNPIPVETQVVNVADVRDYLPDDTPVVTPAERAAELQERMFEYDYNQDQTHGLSWLAYNLEYDQIKAALGADQFTEIFGSQHEVLGVPQDVPSVLDRLTDPALIPDQATIAHDIVANPQESLSAIVNNLPLAARDIDLPALFAVLHLEVVFEQTALAVKDDISSGQLSQVLGDLEE